MLLAALACAPRSAGELDAAHAAAMRDSVVGFATTIARHLSEDGPVAWLRYFETSPAFFMASDGQVVFRSSDSATVLVEGLARTVAALNLEWVELRVEPLAPGLAVVGASYRESITDTAGVIMEFGGFMTAVARHTPDGWRLRNLHWSSPIPPPH
ncbi:MAG: hypothetical protein OEY20_01620 [Gemmatimonadota bacterium]|nr:hypothetical protein [Gemmatimonadota bacterium]